MAAKNSVNVSMGRRVILSRGNASVAKAGKDFIVRRVSTQI